MKLSFGKPFHSILIAMLLSALLLSGCNALDYARLQLLSPSQRFAQEGDRLASEGNPAGALLAYQRAVAEDGQNVEALLKLGAAYADQGRRRLALRYLNQAQTLQPEDPDVQAEIAALPLLTPEDVSLRPIWQAAVGEAVPTGLAFLDGVIYAALEDGSVAAFQADDGAQIWKIRLPVPATSAPAVGDATVLVGGQDGALYALSARDGSLKWKAATRAPLYAPALAAGDAVYAASGDGSLYAFSLADGAPRWSFPTGGALHAAPVLSNGVLYFGSTDARLYAVQAASGAPLWPSGVPVQGAIESQPVVVDAGGRRSVLFGAGDSRVYSLAADTGGEYWRYSTPDSVYARPLVSGETVYVASSGRVLAALDRLTGKPRWELRTEKPLRNPPAVLGEALLYGEDTSSTLYAVDKDTGSPLWEMDSGDWIAAGPLAEEGRLFLAGKDGTLLAYR